MNFSFLLSMKNHRIEKEIKTHDSFCDNVIVASITK